MHALVIGGTGMLKKVSMWLCDQGFHVSIIGRDSTKLENVKQGSSVPGNITCLPLDYHNNEDVKLAIKSTIQRNAPITLVVAWIHSSAKDALSLICNEVELSSEKYSLFHILGSSASRTKSQKIGGTLCSYYRIILGFILEDTYARWHEMKTTVYVTRHGETEWNVAGRMQGRKNSALTENGMIQAKQLGERMKDLPLHAIYSSPSERTLHTAELIKGERDLPIIEDERFYEINMGIWEGQTIADLEMQYPEEVHLFWNEPHLFQSTSGENFAAVHKRVIEGIHFLLEKHKGENILIVTHAAAAKLLVGHFAGFEIEHVWEEPFMHSASLSVIEFDENRGKVKQFADISHFQ
ncbi:phosphoserine phosphatase 1 [Bacillus mycoides]